MGFGTKEMYSYILIFDTSFLVGWDGPCQRYLEGQDSTHQQERRSNLQAFLSCLTFQSQVFF